MFKVTKIGTNRLDIALSGKLNSAEMQDALDDLEKAARGIENGVMLYDVIDFHLPSLGAIAIEFSRLPAMFGVIRKFRRAAVLADKHWIQKASEIEGMLVPGLEIKAFDRDRKNDAEAWLTAQ